ncbi:MAG: hypothetical protein SGJ27_03580 [Candidatus Melainabacteria bacterium]|nr:hypothetical protein [Candidatus Melainabacteria bacterium]
MRNYNLKLSAMAVTSIVAVLALANHAMLLAVTSGVIAVCLLVNLVFAQREIGKSNSDAISQHYDAFVKALNAAQTSAVRKLQGADDATVNAVVAKLIEAGTYMGSNPDWRNTRRIVGAGDILEWYADGKAAAEAALALVDSYAKTRQS